MSTTMTLAASGTLAAWGRLLTGRAETATGESVIIDRMNRGHMEFCTSPVWQEMLEEQILPPVLRDLDLGDDMIEIGPGPGFTTDVLRARAGHVTAVELDE